MFDLRNLRGDLLGGITTGIIALPLALAFVKRLADAQMEGFRGETPAALEAQEKALLDASGGRVLLPDFVGPLSFSAASDLVHLMRERARGEVRAVVLDLTRKPFMDASAVRAVETIVGEAEAQGIEVFLAGASEEVSRLLREMQADREIEADHRFAQRLPALQAALTVAGR
ncbi:MAG: STAS domain-containing protein [Meiothermus sp.]|nr:STAS domain-containing protein [Meiothermus sp.]